VVAQDGAEARKHSILVLPEQQDKVIQAESEFIIMAHLQAHIMVAVVVAVPEQEDIIDTVVQVRLAEAKEWHRILREAVYIEPAAVVADITVLVTAQQVYQVEAAQVLHFQVKTVYPAEQTPVAVEAADLIRQNLKVADQADQVLL
jgi:hypothetical protein